MFGIAPIYYITLQQIYCVTFCDGKKVAVCLLTRLESNLYFDKLNNK